MPEFTITFDQGIQMGLRASDRSPMKSEVLVKSEGLIPEQGILHSLEELEVIGEDLECDWPFPQIFRLKGLVLVCTKVTIYEYSNDSLTELITVDGAGTTWSVADFWPYVAMTNGRYLVRRDPESGTWSTDEDCDFPICICMTEANGQIIVGGPEVRIVEGVL